MAMILVAVFMVQLALVMLMLSGGHQQHMHARLLQDKRNAQRLQHIETIFNELAMDIVANHAAPRGKGGVLSGQRQLDDQTYGFDVEQSPCTHLVKTTTSCWTLSVQAGGTGFRRHRLLHVPLSSCSAPYWYLAEAS